MGIEVGNHETRSHAPDRRCSAWRRRLDPSRAPASMGLPGMIARIVRPGMWRPALRDSKSRSNPHFRSFARIISYSGRSDGSASPLLRVSTQRASYSSLASEQCLALQVFPAEPAQQLAIPLKSHPVEVPRNRGLGSEGSKAADYLMLEYFEGPQFLGLDIASDLSLNRCHSSLLPQESLPGSQ